MRNLTTKKKIAIAVPVCAIFIVIAIIVTCVCVAGYRRSTYGEGIFEVAEYNEIKTVFGDDAMYLKDSFIDENYIQPYKFIDFGKTPNKTQKEGKVTGYDEVAVRYHIELKPQIELADNMTLTDVTAEYDKNAFIQNGTIKEYEEYSYSYAVDTTTAGVADISLFVLEKGDERGGLWVKAYILILEDATISQVDGAVKDTVEMILNNIA